MIKDYSLYRKIKMDSLSSTLEEDEQEEEKLIIELELWSFVIQENFLTPKMNIYRIILSMWLIVQCAASQKLILTLIFF